MAGTTLAALLRAHQMRAKSREVIRPGGEALTGRPPKSIDDQHVSFDGGATYKRLFMPGLDDPDSTELIIP